MYKVGRKVPSLGAADTQRRRLRGGDRVLGSGATRSARAAASGRSRRGPRAPPRSGTPLRVIVRGYDDQGRGKPIEGATVALGSSTATTGAGRRGHRHRPGLRPARAHGDRRRPRPLVPAGGHRRVKRLAVLSAARGSPFGRLRPRLGLEEPSDGALTVTQDFGESVLGTHKVNGVKDSDTVMRVLQGDFDVETRYGGNFVQEIEGVAGGREGGRRVDWFYYVNGIEASVGAGERKVSAGDRIWWDHHDWSSAQRDPRRGGLVPRAVPRRQRGAQAAGAARVPQRRGQGVRRGRGAPRRRRGHATRGARCSSSRRGARCCGCWSARGLRCARTRRRASWSRARPPRACSRGPTRSGDRIELLDERGRVDRVLGHGGGLVAATSIEGQQPTWVVTGTDATGVAAAAAALDEKELRDRFAVAVDEGRTVGAAGGGRGGGSVTYLRRASPLHAARAGVAAAWCVARRAGGAVARAARRARRAAGGGDARRGRARGSGRRVALALAWGVPFALVIALVNALVTRDGLTVLVRGWTLPGLGRMDITLEAVVFSGMLGLRVLVVIGCAALLRGVRGPRRDPARRAPRVGPLGRDRRGRRAADAGAGARRPPAGRRAALPRRRAAAGRRAACGDGGRAGPGDGRRRDARAARVRRAGGARRPGAGRGRATTSRSPPPGWPSRRSASPPSSRAGARTRPSRAWPAPRRRGARRRAGRRASCSRSPTAGGSSERRARARRRHVRLSRRARAGAGGRVADASSRASSWSWPAARARASRRCCARPPGLVPHFHGGTFAGAPARRRAGHARPRAGRAGRGRRHAAAGPRDAGGDGDRAGGARVPAGEPRLGRGGGGPRRGGGGARARHRRAAGPLDARAVRRRAAAGGAGRGASPGARGCCCSTSRPRSSTRWPATSCSACCGGSTRSGAPRCCWPSTGWSAACPPPTACSRSSDGRLVFDGAPEAFLREHPRPRSRGCSRSPGGRSGPCR